MTEQAEVIIEQINSSYNRLLRLYQSVPVARLIEPSLPNGWSVKDLLGHIATWEWRCASLLEAAQDTDAPLTASPAIDALNEESYEERKEWSWSEVEIDFRQSHQALLSMIRELPPARLANPLVQRSLAEETWEHYAEHLPDLEGWHRRMTSNR